jgi:hypothetical protein
MRPCIFPTSSPHSGRLRSAWLFFWALNRGQFRDQQRARFCRWGARGAAASKLTRRGRIETYGLIALVCCGLAGSAAVIVFALTHPG